MWLFFSSRCLFGEVHPFSLYCRQIEEHFEVLNSFVAAGYRLEEAYVVDEGKRIDLPLEAFDGQPMSASLRELQEQYQQVLSS
ncbi:hypothetical protein ACFPMF_15375 [Larkinella bovis]|uniref:Uncharacterized protein n=1 Tax=Larkinella bovis TaxID=683041 RepID=A0ABW0IDV8_9BACT